MENKSVLITKANLGDPIAFGELVSPYLKQLTTWLEYTLDDDGEDCLQEALLAAWLKLPQLKQPEQFKSWLFRIARNRCMDYLRRHRKERLVETPLENELGYLSRMSYSEGGDSLSDLISQLTGSERYVIWSYYVERVPIRQISQERNVTEGTIKRLLYNGRNRLRLTINQEEEGVKAMSNIKQIVLPDERPTIEIRQIQVEPFQVILSEQPWFFVPLEVGGKAQWCMYDPPDWCRTDTCLTKVTGHAQVHGLDCLEITEEWDSYEGGKVVKRKWRTYVRQMDDFVQILATISVNKGVLNINTFLDENYVDRWGDKNPRIWQDDGRFSIEGNHLTTTDRTKSGGAGFYEVRIGQKVFSCLRVFNSSAAKGDAGTLVEAYLTQEGRTVLFRRYNDLNWRRSPDWYPSAQANHRLFLDGVEYIHWYDCLSNYSLGITI